jgi:hypothetical protein
MIRLIALVLTFLVGSSAYGIDQTKTPFGQEGDVWLSRQLVERTNALIVAAEHGDLPGVKQAYSEATPCRETEAAFLVAIWTGRTNIWQYLLSAITQEKRDCLWKERVPGGPTRLRVLEGLYRITYRRGNDQFLVVIFQTFPVWASIVEHFQVLLFSRGSVSSRHGRLEVRIRDYPCCLLEVGLPSLAAHGTHQAEDWRLAAGVWRWRQNFKVGQDFLPVPLDNTFGRRPELVESNFVYASVITWDGEPTPLLDPIFFRQEVKIRRLDATPEGITEESAAGSAIGPEPD